MSMGEHETTPIESTSSTNITNSNIPTTNQELDHTIRPTTTTANRVTSSNLQSFFFDNTFYTTTIPVTYKHHLKATINPDDLVTIKDHINISGYNKLTKSIYINGSKIKTDRNGNYSYNLPLTNYGKQTIHIVFTTLDNKLICLNKKINHLFSPQKTKSDNSIKQTETLFYNSNLLHNIHQTSITDTVSRAQLAYFITLINSNTTPTNSINKIIQINDVTPNEWYFNAAQTAIKQHWMGNYPNNKFYPNKPITKLEAIITLIRAKNLPLNYNNLNLNYTDINNNHWAAKYIKKAQDLNIIKPAKQLNPHKPITIQDLITMTKEFDTIQTSFKTIHDIHLNNPVVTKNFMTAITSALNEIKDIIKNPTLNTSFTINSYDHNDVIFEQNITINGKTIPPSPFYFNNNIITPNILGEFSFPLTLHYGKNSYNVTVNNSSTTYTLLYLDSYKDLNNHWLKKTAAQLKYLGLTSDTDYFYPKEEITKEQFYSLTQPFLSNTNHIPTPQININITPNYDITANLTLTYNIFEEVTTANFEVSSENFLTAHDMLLIDVTTNITTSNHFSLIDHTEKLNQLTFIPSQNMQLSITSNITRAQALAYLINYQETYNTPLTASKKESFPFWDIPKTHWARAYVEKAYDNHWISAAYSFNPDKPLLKDQLIVLLANNPLIIEKINTIIK